MVSTIMRLGRNSCLSEYQSCRLKSWKRFQTALINLFMDMVADGIEKKTAQGMSMSSVCVLARPNKLCIRRIRRSPLRRLKKADVVHHAFHVGDHAFDLLMGRGVVFPVEDGSWANRFG